MSSNTKKTRKHFDWAFDGTTQFASSDEESEPDDPDDQKSVTTNIRARELRIDDLDLSTREEHVAYTPNPFSIAKINAAYRPTSTVNGPPLIQPTQPLKPAQPMRPANKLLHPQQLTKRSRTNQITIMEGFKTQAMKTSRAGNALRLRLPPLQPTNNPIHPNFDLAVDKPIFSNQDVSVASTLPTSTLLSTSAIPTLPSFSTTIVPSALDFPSTSSRPSEYAHILTPKASQPRNTQTLSTISQSHSSAPAQRLPDMWRHQRKCTNNEGPVFSSFSSPGHRYDDSPLDHGSRTRHFQTYSSPTQPVQKSIFRPYLRQNSEKGFLPPFVKSFGPKGVSLRRSTLEPSSPTVKIEDQSGRFEGLKSVDDHVVQGNKTPEFLRHSSTLPSTSKLRHPAKSLSPLASLLPSASLVSSTSNYLARKRIPEDSSSFMPVKSYPKRDVYQYPTEDLEEEWTTLPSKKRKRKPKTVLPDPSYTKSFCIRGLRLPPAMKTETVIAPAARRKKIYLPPPLETDRKHLPPSSPTNSDVNAYPSPSTLSSKPLLASISQAKRNDDYTPPRSRPGVGVVTPYRPPSPPPSDFPIPSDADMRVEIDEEGIKVGHPEITRLLRKRRRASADMWNLLGLDSCGSVRKDVDQEEQDEQMEIQIVVWPTA